MLSKLWQGAVYRAGTSGRKAVSWAKGVGESLAPRVSSAASKGKGIAGGIGSKLAHEGNLYDRALRRYGYRGGTALMAGRV